MISENLIFVRSNEESSIWSHVIFLNFKCMHSWTLRACKLYWHSKVALLVCRETIVSSEGIALFNFKCQRFFKDYDKFNHRFLPSHRIETWKLRRFARTIIISCLLSLRTNTDSKVSLRVQNLISIFTGVRRVQWDIRTVICQVYVARRWNQHLRIFII